MPRRALPPLRALSLLAALALPISLAQANTAQLPGPLEEAADEIPPAPDLPGATVPPQPAEPLGAPPKPPSPATDRSATNPASFRQIVQEIRPLTARVATSGRVGAGLLVLDGTHVITLLRTVHVGLPAAIVTGDGHTSLARIVSWDRLHGVALLALDAPPAPRAAPTIREAAPAVGDELIAVGHGGSIGLSVDDEDLRALSAFSPLATRVVAAQNQTVEQFEARVFPDFLVDRAPGEGDAGAPLFDTTGALVGLLREAVEAGGGRALAVPGAVLRDLLDAPRDRRYPRPSHLQTWSGFGVAAHNRPSIVAGLVRLGARIAIADRLRIEPWVEADLGTRAPHASESEDGESIARGRDLFWSIEAGADVGCRVPIRVEGSRDYVVPNVGFRVGWNRFQQRHSSLVATCPEGATCAWSTESTLDQRKEVRAGLDFGLDVRHGRVRLGYRFFLDPTAPALHSMHRLFVTFDGFPLDIAVGDSR